MHIYLDICNGTYDILSVNYPLYALDGWLKYGTKSCLDRYRESLIIYWKILTDIKSRLQEISIFWRTSSKIRTRWGRQKITLAKGNNNNNYNASSLLWNIGRTIKLYSYIPRYRFYKCIFSSYLFLFLPNNFIVAALHEQNWGSYVENSVEYPKFKYLFVLNWTLCLF